MCYTYQPLEVSVTQGIKVCTCPRFPDADTADVGHIKTHRYTYHFNDFYLHI